MTMVALSVGNLVGTEIFQPRDAPAYIPGKTAILVLLCAQLVAALWLRSINIRLNERKRAQLAEEKTRRSWTGADVQKERERHAFLDLTDTQYARLVHLRVFRNDCVHRNMFFVYTA